MTAPAPVLPTQCPECDSTSLEWASTAPPQIPAVGSEVQPTRFYLACQECSETLIVLDPDAVLALLPVLAPVAPLPDAETLARAMRDATRARLDLAPIHDAGWEIVWESNRRKNEADDALAALAALRERGLL